MKPYDTLKERLAKGWNTWNTRSVLSHVLLPEGFAVNLGIKEYKNGRYLKEALIGRFGDQEEKIHPGPHAYDGSYTALNLKWQDIELSVESAVLEDELYLIVTPLQNQKYPCALVVEAGMLWNRPGKLWLEGNGITAELPNQLLTIHATKEAILDPHIAVQTPHLVLSLDESIGVTTGCKKTMEEIKAVMGHARQQHSAVKEAYGDLAEAYHAMQSCMAWDTIYEPKKDRVVTTVSRLWNMNNGGYALFCWDTYFGAMMAAVDHKDLAYANAIEITREKSPDGFIPNALWGNGFASLDRSQPPVGSLAVKELYRRYREKWLLEELFDDLYGWNEWFHHNRQLKDGTLAWGSNPYPVQYDNYWETAGVNDTFGAALESGLDNSPMYDDIPFDKDKHRLELSDVGLTGLYIMDCHALSDIALEIGRFEEARKLQDRANHTEQGLQTLWDVSTGIFLNKRTDTGAFSPRLSPTNFYALFGSSVTPEQAEQMIQEHFYNPEEFWGDWVLPSISRNDPAYPDQNYWRGRIWAPMNFLVYLGLRNHTLTQPMMDLSILSVKLLLKEWLEMGHVHENYCADTGEGCGKHNSDKFYHWGALLSLIALMEAGYMEGPEKPL